MGKSVSCAIALTDALTTIGNRGEDLVHPLGSIILSFKQVEHLMFSEKDMEDAIIRDPERYLGEAGLRLTARQYRIGSYVFDLLFEDRHGANLIVEIQKGTLDRNHTYKILDYFDEYKSKNADKFVELMVVANKIPRERRDRLKSYGVTYKEIPDSEFIALKAASNKNASDSEGQLSSPRVPSESVKPGDQLIHNKETKAMIISNGLKKERYQTFFQSLIDDLRKHHVFSNAKASNKNNHYFIAGRGLYYCPVFAKDGVRIELYIDQRDKGANKRIFDYLFKNKDVIHARLGYSLVWDRYDDGQHSKIFLSRNGSIDSSQDVLRELHKWMVENILKFKESFEPFLKEFS